MDALDTTTTAPTAEPYDADRDPAWFVYLARNGSLDWKPGEPKYEELMTRYQKEGVRFENKKTNRSRTADKQRAEEERWREDFRAQ